jgi:hypothetical protein
VRALSRSAMAMDIYTWLTYRNACISRPTTVPWEALMVQFGSEASRSKFRELFEKNLKSVLAVYPQAKVSTSSSGILLVPSQPSVRKVAR